MSTVQAIPMIIVTTIIQANALTVALVLLGVCLAIIALVYILVYYFRPRLFL